MKRRTTIALLLGISTALILCSCTPSTDKLTEALKPVKEQFAPDKRVAVFQVLPEWQGDILVVKGEVDNPSAKTEAIRVLREKTVAEVVDSILVLPDPALGEKQFGIVTVSVGNVRSKPGHPEELATQVLMGMVVKVLKKKGGWYYVQSHDRYLGWMETESIVLTDQRGVDAWRSEKKVIVSEYFSIVRDKPAPSALPVTDVVAGVIMRRGSGGNRRWQQVFLPDGRPGFIEQGVVEEYESWKKGRTLNAENVERVSKMFLGVPYLWGGTSPKGFDCSGYTKTVFRLNGLELNRDANQQALMGEEVPLAAGFETFKKGDLLFFGRTASGGRPERIWHVGIYLGNLEFIHCSGRVRVNSLDPAAPHFDADRLNTLVRAKRLIGISTIPEVG